MTTTKAKAPAADIRDELATVVDDLTIAAIRLKEYLGISTRTILDAEASTLEADASACLALDHAMNAALDEIRSSTNALDDLKQSLR